MRITIAYENGDTVTLVAVKSIWVVAPGTVEIACYGNSAVRHRQVQGFTVEPFVFAFAEAQ